MIYKQIMVERRPLVYRERRLRGWCGPAALSMALESLSLSVSQEELAAVAPYDPNWGTDHAAMLRAARKYRPNAYELTGRSVDELLELARNNVVIVNFTDPDPGTAFPAGGGGNGDDGHYVLLDRADGDDLLVVDPNPVSPGYGGFRRIKRDWFERYFWDIDRDGAVVEKWALIFPMMAEELHSLLKERIAARSDLSFVEIPLEYKAGQWSLMRIASKQIGPTDKILLIRATIHGDETAGALTILRYFDQLVDYAHQRGVKLVIYPLGNPSGFERGTRYNVDNDRGDEGNNDFLRYEMPDGSFVGDLGAGKPFKRWLVSDSDELSIQLPLEARTALSLIKKDPLDQVAAALDLHQDYLTKGLPACAYHYIFGESKVYQPITDEIARVVSLLKYFDVDAGYGEQIDERGQVVARENEGGVFSDQNGAVVRFDGSFSDFFHRRGVRHSVATETSGATPLDQACLVNWIWIKGMIDLIG